MNEQNEKYSVNNGTFAGFDKILIQEPDTSVACIVDAQYYETDADAVDFARKLCKLMNEHSEQLLIDKTNGKTKNES